MALSGSISLNPSAVVVAQKCQATLTISNSASSELFLSNLVPHCFSTPEPSVQAPVAAQLGLPFIPPNSPVPAGGSIKINFPVVFQAGSGLGTISVGCLMYSADGQVVDATPATIVVTGNVQTA